MSGFVVGSKKLSKLQQVFGLLEPATEPSLQEIGFNGKSPEVSFKEWNAEIKKFFPSSNSYLEFINNVNLTREVVRDHWEDFPDDLKQVLRDWVCLISNRSTKEGKNLVWRRIGLFASVTWASFRFRRNIPAEIAEAGHGLANAILEQIAVEPPQQVQSIESYLGIIESSPQTNLNKVLRRGPRRVQSV